MALAPGTRLGPYEVTVLIGEGGMGQVFRATDTKLKRQVAIKILPPALAADPDRLARFQREAEVLASLNHPHIAGIYGLEESEGVSALVMELVDGEDLSQRIARGAVPIDEALPIAKQLADALEAAHEQGILQREPDLDALPGDVPARVRQTLHVCLRKDSKQRVGDIRDVRLALEGAFETPAPESAATRPSSSRGSRLAWLVAAAAVLVAVGLAIPAFRYLREGRPVPPPETRVDIVTPPTNDPVSFALSPDGKKIVFVASADGASRLWLRSLNSTTAQPLVGTEGAVFPFWSPDSRSVAFFAARHFVFYALGEPDVTGIFLGVLDSDVTKRLTVADSAGVFLPPGQTLLTARAILRQEGTDRAGWLLWVRDGALVGQRLDVDGQVMVGKPVTLAGTVLSFGGTDNRSALSASASGLVAYRSGGTTRRQLTWFDRNGKALSVMGTPDRNNLQNPRLSPDGRRVAVSRTVMGNQDLWLMDGARTSRYVRCRKRRVPSLVSRRSPDRLPIGSKPTATPLREGRQRCQRGDPTSGFQRHQHERQRLVQRRPLSPVSGPKPADRLRPVGLAHGGRPQTAGARADALSRPPRPILSRRSLGGLHV